MELVDLALHGAELTLHRLVLARQVVQSLVGNIHGLQQRVDRAGLLDEALLDEGIDLGVALLALGRFEAVEQAGDDVAFLLVHGEGSSGRRVEAGRPRMLPVWHRCMAISCRVGRRFPGRRKHGTADATTPEPIGVAARRRPATKKAGASPGLRRS